MPFYAIRHRISGFFLPERSAGRGYSYTEPTDGAQPRLFTTLHAAKIALTYWLKGKATTYYDDGGYVVDGFSSQPHRRREDMEIVAVELQISQVEY